MFNKDSKKAIVKFRSESENHRLSTTSVALKDGKLLEYMKNVLNRYGELVIQDISDDNTIIITTSRTIDNNNIENRLDEIDNVIRNFIKNRAIPMKAHAVIVDGNLKGVFGNETHALLKRKTLISKGYSEDSIVIKDIEIDSFQDFE